MSKKKIPSTYDIIKYKTFNYIPSVVLNSILIYYIYRLEKEKCDCSKDWRRDALRVMTIYNILTIIGYGFLTDKQIKKIPFIIHVFNVIYGCVYMYIVFSYLNKLRKECECASGTDANILYYYYLSLVSLIGLVFIFGLYFALYALI